MRRAPLRLTSLWLMFCLLLTGCAVKNPFAKDKAPEQQQPADGQASSPMETPAETAAHLLFPAQDTRYRFDVTDAGKLTYQVTEEWIREGDRLVAVVAGTPYAQWTFRPDGVYRLDPKGGGAFLRYLPAKLERAAWKQQSGDAEVWFSLFPDTPANCAPEGGTPAAECWTLLVLNRGDGAEFRFGAGLGPVLAYGHGWAHPADSFAKTVISHQPARVEEAKRSRYLAAIQPMTGEPGPVVPVTTAEFQAQLASMKARAPSGSQTSGGQDLYDITGPEKQERLVGTPGIWTRDTLDLTDASGDSLLKLAPATGKQHRLTPFRFDSFPRTVFLYEQGTPEQLDSVAIIAGRHDGQRMRPDFVTGWAVKVRGATASSWTVKPDGSIQVEQQLRDAVRHKAVIAYRFDAQDLANPRVERLSTRLVRQGGHPQSEADLIQAAFAAWWYSAADELRQYFATPEAGSALLNLTPSPPDYAPGTTSLGRAIPDADPSGAIQMEQAPIGPDGRTEFLASWGGYEWSAQLYGQVTFGKDSQGRPVITNLQILKHKHFGG